MTDDKNAAAPIDWTAPEMQYLEAEDYKLPPADPVLLASANRMLSDRLERVAHVLRGCGLPALANISGAEDLQMATAALSGSYQMALADAAAVPDLRNITAELEATVALQRETLVTAAADVSRLSAELATERQAREALQEQAGTVEAVGYFVTSASHGPRYFSKRENAIRDAMKNARLGWCARVIPAGKPIGVARKGAEWRAA